MDNDLNRSVRLLDEAASSQCKSLLRKAYGNIKRHSLNLSVTARFSAEDTCFYDQTFNSVLEDNKTLTGSVIRANEPWNTATDSLYSEFFEILQTHSESNEILGLIAEMSRCCSDTLNVVNGLKSKVVKMSSDDTWLENERNTWRLLYVLFGNRLNPATCNEESDIYLGPSEKYSMLSLFKRDTLVRESQLVIDWLECNAAQKDDKVLHYSDSTVGWENTLHQIKSSDTIVFGASRQTVSRLDPDAPHYQKLPLHDLDAEDDKRLTQKIFQEIRCGKLDEAQKLATYCGHAWRAGLLEGWKLYHNPNLVDMYSKEFEENFEEETAMEKQYKPIEGNQSRDIWKAMAWKCMDVATLNPYEMATIAAYSGNLQPLVNVCTTWEDHLWAYLRVMVDIRVESELRENVTRKYMPMPDYYWDQRMSINEIFTCLESSNIQNIQSEALTTDHQIQKFIILDEIDKLTDCITDWILEPNVTPQFLRFLTHLLMFLEHIGQLNNREVVERVLEEYIKTLIDMNHTQLIAFYVSKLNESEQVNLYSSYLETIVQSDERKESLLYAENCGLNVSAITKQVVESIRARHDASIDGDFQKSITPLDEFKISSLDWLLFHESQLPELLKQTNALIYQFLTMRKLDAAQLSFNKLPIDIIAKINSDPELEEHMQQDVREYLSYQAYLDAQEAFNTWFKSFKGKPVQPQSPSDGAAFTEKVAFEHKTSQYKADMERWKLTIGELAKLARNALYNILLFPDGGWLSGAQDARYLQATCIPECTLLLYTVLYDSERYEECVQLADIVVNEKYKLYEVYSTEKLGELLRKLSESSVALLNQKKDPWGQETSA